MELQPDRAPRAERVALVRRVSYEVLTSLEGTIDSSGESKSEQGVLLNISQGGMLLLTTRTLPPDVPLLVNNAAFRDVVPVYGLGEPVWTCPFFFTPGLHFVGIRFLE